MNTRQNILHLCETWGTGGAENVMLNVAAGLDQNQWHSVAVLFGQGWLTENLAARGVETVILKTSGSVDFGLLWGLIKTIRHHRIDLIHSHLPDANAYACLAGRLTAVPVVATYHGKVGTSPKRFESVNIKLAAVRKWAARVVAVSGCVKSELIELAGMDDTHVDVIYNGVNWSGFKPKLDLTSAKKRLGFDPSDQVVTMVANLSGEKGYEYFVRAARLIADKTEHTQFLIVGEGFDYIRQMIDTEIKANDVADKVHLLGYREDVSEILSATDLFMLSSTSEGLSIATIEAMGMGVPVLVTASGGPEEIVTNRETGLIVPIKDEAALARGALELLNDSKLATRLADNGSRHVKDKFDIRHMIEQYQQLYECLLAIGGNR